MRPVCTACVVGVSGSPCRSCRTANTSSPGSTSWIAHSRGGSAVPSIRLGLGDVEVDDDQARGAAWRCRCRRGRWPGRLDHARRIRAGSTGCAVFPAGDWRAAWCPGRGGTRASRGSRTRGRRRGCVARGCSRRAPISGDGDGRRGDGGRGAVGADAERATFGIGEDAQRSGRPAAGLASGGGGSGVALRAAPAARQVQVLEPCGDLGAGQAGAEPARALDRRVVRRRPVRGRRRRRRWRARRAGRRAGTGCRWPR